MDLSLFNLYLFQIGLAFLCVGTTGGSGGMQWVAVLCLLSGEWWPGVLRVRLDGQLMSDVHLFSLQPLLCLWKYKVNFYNHLQTTTTFLLIHTKQQHLFLCVMNM